MNFFVTENRFCCSVEKLTYAKDEEELSRAIIIKQNNRPQERQASLPRRQCPGASLGPHP